MPGLSSESGNEGQLRPVGGTWALEGQHIVVQTNAQGVAETDLATTFAAGDNFRVAASIDENVLVGLTNVPTSGAIAGFGGKATGQLSVWRSVHIESDRMTRTDSVDKQDGNIAIPSTAPANGEVTVTVDFAMNKAGRYAGGILRTGGTNYKVVGNTATTFVVVESNAVIAAGPVSIYEDDFAAPAGSPNALPITIVNTEDDSPMYDFMQETTNRSQNRFADAYIVPELNSLDQFRSFVASTPHVSDTAGLLDLYGQSAGTNAAGSSTDLFWVVYVTSAYEPDANVDRDPADEVGSVGGITTGQFAGTEYASFVFFEVVRDRDPISFPGSLAISATAIHEVGHQFGLSQTANDHRDGIENIMNTLPLDVPNGLYYFHAEDIAHLRSRHESPGTL